MFIKTCGHTDPGDGSLIDLQGIGVLTIPPIPQIIPDEKLKRKTK